METLCEWVCMSHKTVVLVFGQPPSTPDRMETTLASGESQCRIVTYTVDTRLPRPFKA